MKVTLQLNVLGVHLGSLTINVDDQTASPSVVVSRPATKLAKRMSRLWFKGMTA